MSNVRMDWPQRKKTALCLLCSLWPCLLMIFAAMMTGCDEPRFAPNMPIQVAIGSRNYKLEIARTEKDREFGLMFRNSMPPDRGMLFVFPDQQPRGFWMKNTKIPLDILFLDTGGRVVSIHTMTPLSTRTTQSASPARFAIELNAGQAAAAGIKAGDIIVLPPIEAE